MNQISQHSSTALRDSRPRRRLAKALVAVSLCAMVGSAALLTGCADPPHCTCDAAITKLPLGDFHQGGTGTFAILVDYFGHPLCGGGQICITDTLDPAFTYQSASPSSWTCTPQPGNAVRCCYAGPLPTSHTTLPTLNLTVNVKPGASPKVKNCASIAQGTKGDFLDEDPTNNESCTAANVLSGDLSIQKQHVGPFVVGQTGVFSLGVSNLGAGPVSPVVVTDVLDPAFTFVSASPSATPGPGWTCTAAPLAPPQTVTCTYSGAIPPMTSLVPLLLTVQIQGKPQTVKNCASVAWDGDPTPKNNSSCDTVDIGGCKPLVANLSSGINDLTMGPIAPGAAEDTWSLVSTPDMMNLGPPRVAVPYPGWMPGIATSGWMSPMTDNVGNASLLPPAGSYVYETCFCLSSAFTLPMLDLTLRADNSITSVAINGCTLAGSSGGVFSAMTPLHVQESNVKCFREGKNCVEVTVSNAGGATGLDVAGSMTANNAGQCCQ